MTRQEEKLQKQAMIRKVLDQLGEHFDCVQIVALDSCGKVESHYAEGSGSWYARMQALREVLWMDEARTKHGAIADTLEADPPDDPETWQFL